MQFFLKSAIVVASMMTLSGLTACGGGNDPAPDTSNRVVQSIAAPANTLVLIDANTATTTSFPKGNYTLDTGYSDASGVASIPGHVIEWVWPENLAFDSGLFFSQNDPRKFAVGLYDQAAADTSYRCVSSAWTNAELSDLAVLLGDTDVITAQKCPDTISIDVAGHHVSFNEWTLLSDDRSKSVKLSVNVSWLLQNGTLSTGGSGGGGGSTSSGSLINNDALVNFPSDALLVTRPGIPTITATAVSGAQAD